MRRSLASMAAVLLTAVAASLAASLAGCSTPQQRAAQQQAQMDQMIAEYGPACDKLGYSTGSDPWRNCVVQLSARQQVGGGGVSTSIFGSWGNWGRWGRGTGVGAGVTVGR